MAAVTTTCVTAWAILLVVAEWRRAGQRSLLSVVSPGEPIAAVRVQATGRVRRSHPGAASGGTGADMESPVWRWYRRWTTWAGVALIVLSLALTAFYLTGELIGSGVTDAVGLASADYPGDRVEALIAYVESDRHPLSQRNRAVWALGQIGDPRALPTLQKHYTGGPCDHERLICQHELEKALRLCRGSFNVTAIVWR